jgi:hypothetical protein
VCALAINHGPIHPGNKAHKINRASASEVCSS